ncbi:PE-PGRS family protein [Runella sp. MFBS21]|uniref:PE-PGRS family protein n=1 Tax=Runella sp. MFBS21 TaxID=3034018 RepID=UPI0023F62B31|nr:PE-PGRS family protein [Runella sp. MFBS21]MDF7818265.1 PE-PGRS family protein [Runella sp. MFBS21]
MKLKYFALAFYILCLWGCKKEEPPIDLESTNFSDTPTSHVVQPADDLGEASGLADSHKQPGLLWSHEDAGSDSELFLLNRQGMIVGKIPTPFSNYDWEDIAIGPGPIPNETFLYVADIGDNCSCTDIKRIYRFPEPASPTAIINNYEPIAFRYPDGTHDAETILLDPLTKDLYVITKWLGSAHVYRLAYPQSTTNVITAEKVATMTVGNDLTGGSISTNGREIIVRGYTAIYYWKRNADEKISDVLAKAPLKNLPYILEPQGEAVCFDKDGKGYFTLSERRTLPSVNLYFYARK